jgi:hypothetical protein
MKMREDFASGFGDKRSGFHITTTHRHTRPFSPGNLLTKNNTTVVSHAPYFSPPRLKIKPNGHHFDTTEVIEAESQAVLNALTEHNFQDVFKKWQKSWERCIRAEGDNLEDDGGQ